jgi:hypothetical protein
LIRETPQPSGWGVHSSWHDRLVSWPPQIGELLPRAEDAYGVREKLVDYSLKAGHPKGKAEAFARALAVTADDLEYVAEALLRGSASRRCPAFGLRACTASTARSWCKSADFATALIGSRTS